jgi:hypothetical protein
MTTKLLSLICSVVTISHLVAAPIDDTIDFQLIADNDFALFAGTSNSVTRLVYQNNTDWPNQLAQESGFTFSFNPDETTLYLLALGGGNSEENVGGYINGVNITSAGAKASGNVSSLLTNYNFDGNVVQGTYNVSLQDMISIIPQVSWGDPTLLDYGGVGSLINGSGFKMQPGEAIIYRFSSEAVPEPSTYALFGIGAIGMLMVMRRKKTA